jgi:hypothetical protein
MSGCRTPGCLPGSDLHDPHVARSNAASLPMLLHANLSSFSCVNRSNMHMGPVGVAPMLPNSKADNAENRDLVFKRMIVAGVALNYSAASSEH